jgi:uncharacterized membrane protein
MKRDTTIVAAVIAALAAFILAAGTFCTWAIAHGASMQWRLMFRILCHGRPERCLSLWGVPMPICARCTAIYAGFLAGVIVFRIVPRLQERTARYVLMVAVAPMALDGLTQLARLRESTNELRLESGLAAGVAFTFWVLSAVESHFFPSP